MDKKKIHKAADANPEFLGVSGKYVNYTIYAIGICFTVFLTLNGTELPIYIRFGVPISLLIGSVFIIRTLSVKYGSAGLDKALIEGKSPNIIYIDSASPFKNLIE